MPKVKGAGKPIGEHICIWIPSGRRWWKNYAMVGDPAYEALMSGVAVPTGRKRKNVVDIGRLIEYADGDRRFWIKPGAMEETE